eukprot:scaffold221_cov351-Pavlova_lutheri.AAC.47
MFDPPSFSEVQRKSVLWDPDRGDVDLGQVSTEISRRSIDAGGPSWKLGTLLTSSERTAQRTPIQ